MSSDSDSLTLQQVIQILTEEAYENVVTNYFLYAGLAILIWDTILTFDREVKHVWRTKITLGSYLYLLSRYGSMANLFVSCFSPLIISQQACLKIQVVAIPVTLISTHAFFGLFIARAYAISGRRIITLLILLPLDVTRFANNIVGIMNVVAECHHGDGIPPSLQRRLSIVANINAAMSISTQVLCFLITVYHTFGTWRALKRMSSTSATKHVTVTVLEQGFYQFGLLIIIVIVTNVATYTLPPRVQVFLDTSALGVAVPTAVFARFCLTLRERNAPMIREVDTKHSSDISWAWSEARLVAEFGDRSPTSPSSRNTDTFASLSPTERVSESDDIAMDIYTPVADSDDTDHVDHFVVSGDDIHDAHVDGSHPAHVDNIPV